jgi:hypothetical protein
VTRALALLLCLAACAPDVKVVTRVEYTLPTPPSADLLTPPPSVVTAGSKDVGEVIGRLSLGNLARDRIIAGWILWYSAAKQSAEHANAPQK